MALFSFRDSWNVWRRKVDEALGTVEPIPAEDIIYNNSGSGLSATNVQSAINEIAGVKGNYIIIDSNVKFTHVYDGVLSIKEILTDIFSQFRTAASALANDELLIIEGLSIPYNNTLNPCRYIVVSNSSDINFISFDSNAVTTDLVRIREANMTTDGNEAYFRVASISTATNTLSIQDVTNDIPPSSTRTMELHCMKLKKI